MQAHEDGSPPAALAWDRPLRPEDGPRYLQIVERLRQAIASGELAAGAQVPAQRRLAAQLGVDLTTVTRAYTEARRRGLIASFSSRGSFVLAPVAQDPVGRVDLAMNVPPVPADSALQTLIDSGLQAAFQRYGTALLTHYADEGAGRSLAQAGQAWLPAELEAAGAAGSERLLVCDGAQQALWGILSLTMQRGEPLLCEPLIYPGLLRVVQQLGLRLQAVQTDAQGMVPQALQAAQRASGARVLYLSPTLNNPTTRTMPEARRQALAQQAAQSGLILIEDDPHRELLAAPLAPVCSFEPGLQAWYVASLSKCLCPGLRTAFVFTPSAAARTALQQAVPATAVPLLMALAEQWMRSGAARQHVQAVRREVRARQALAGALLPQAQADPQGLHLWLPLPPPWTQHAFAHSLEEMGISVAVAQAFSATHQAPEAVRISLGGAVSQPVLRQALETIAALLQTPPRPESRAIV